MLGTLFVIALLVALNALFVAIEFAMVAVRRTRVESLAQEGDARARLLLEHVGDSEALERVVSGSQIGITASSLLLGAFGQDSLSGGLAAFLSGTIGVGRDAALPIATAVVLLGLTLLQVVFGELVPKAVVVRYPETAAMLVIYPASLFTRRFRRVIDILYAMSRAILKLLHVPLEHHKQVLSSEDLERLFTEGSEVGSLRPEEHQRLRRVLRFGRCHVREMMVPLSQVQTVPADLRSDELADEAARSPHTRLPVVGREGKVIGFVHLKDVAIALAERGNVRIEEITRPLPVLLESMPAPEVFSFLRARRAQMAVVVDAQRELVGLITLEDLMEEILGEVQDEFDGARR